MCRQIPDICFPFRHYFIIYKVSNICKLAENKLELRKDIWNKERLFKHAWYPRKADRILVEANLWISVWHWWLDWGASPWNLMTENSSTSFSHWWLDWGVLVNQTTSVATWAVVIDASAAAAVRAWAKARASLICSSPASPRLLSFKDNGAVSEANLLILSLQKYVSFSYLDNGSSSEE